MERNFIRTRNSDDVCEDSSRDDRSEQLCFEFPGIRLIRQEALIEMAYQLGNTKQRKFVKLKRAIEHEQWQTAGLEVLDSLWARQTVMRARRISEMIHRGEWYERR